MGMSGTGKGVSAKRHYLMNLFSRNRTLFYALFQQHVKEFMPIVYDPGIAESIRNYSDFFVTPQNAVYLSIDRQDQLEQALVNGAEGRRIRLMVVTDGEAILGIGDWGTNGVSISTGKLMVYTAAAGIDPSQVLPVVLDAGTMRLNCWINTKTPIPCSMTISKGRGSLPWLGSWEAWPLREKSSGTRNTCASEQGRPAAASSGGSIWKCRNKG